MKVKLSEILEGLEFQNGENQAYLNVKTGEVVFLTEDVIAAAEDDEGAGDYPEWMREGIEKAEEIYVEESPDYIQLPDRFEIHEYRMMEDFIGTVEDADQQRQLARSIQGSGAFRRFKDTVYDLDLEKAWFAFRDGEYKRVAREWCEANGVEFTEAG